MTNKEAIKELQQGMPTENATDEECERYVEAYKMAIKALEQEPCEDCINKPKEVLLSEKENFAIKKLEKIKDKMMDDGAYFQEVEGYTDFVKGISHCIDIVEKELLRLEEER